MLSRISFRGAGPVWAGVGLILLGACESNPVRPPLVSNVTASVAPAAYLGPCPGTFNLSAEVTARTGSVDLRWEFSDGTALPTRALTFSETGTRTVTDTWRPDGVGSFWARIHVLSPEDLLSNQVSFTNGCGALAVTATASVTPASYSADCPATFELSGGVTANGAWTVTYRWERSDGGMGPTEELTFETAGTKTVTHSWQVAETGSFQGWIHLLTPIDQTSNVAAFTNTCGSATSAIATASPSTYSGDCPGTFTASADLTAATGTITYRWERSDGTSSPAEALTFNTGGTRSVADTWEVAAIGPHWERLHVLTPNDLYSNQAAFTNDCGAAGPFAVTAVTASVSPSQYYGGCPGPFVFSADISVNGGSGIGTVTYRWEGSDGTIGPTETVAFSGPGIQTITASPLYDYMDGSFWQRVHVLTPNDLYSNQAEFSVGCCFFCEQ